MVEAGTKKMSKYGAKMTVVGGTTGVADQGNVVIGIDPGANTGIAIYHGGKLTSLHTIDPYRIAEYVAGAARVVFEDSRLTSFVFTTAMSRASALKMARNVGEIDAWCKLIVALCADLGIPAHGISPKGKGAKVKAPAFDALTGWAGSSNEHTRDAAMVAWPYRRAA